MVGLGRFAARQDGNRVFCNRVEVPMQFNSIEFLLFAAAFFACWPVFRQRASRRWAYLVAASSFFYGWWDPRFLLLILASGLLDFAMGLAIESFPKRRILLLSASICGNLAALIAFKYADFLIANINWLRLAAGGQTQWSPWNLALPIGISFYTFQSMSYTIDVYRGRLRATRNVLHFFAYLMMFPQLVAGPIVRAADMLEQLQGVHTPDEEQRWEGLRLIVYGFFKKVVIADGLAYAVNASFAGTVSQSNGCYWWLTASFFGIQIYCDFSGYSDIARGLAKWMGYDLALNFNQPYAAIGMRDFWSRWHISLSTWFRDYVYIPLGGSRSGTLRDHGNLWITMVLSGVWHGAAWTFVVWGCFHAACLSFERWTNWPLRLRRIPCGSYLGLGLTFCIVTLSWVFFRAPTLQQAGQITWSMFDFANFDVASLPVQLPSRKAILLAGLFAAIEIGLHFIPRLAHPVVIEARYRFEPVLVGVLMTMCVFLRGPGDRFIYFQF